MRGTCNISRSAELRGQTLFHVCKIEFYPKRKALSTVQNKDGSGPDDEAALNSNVCVENGKK